MKIVERKTNLEGTAVLNEEGKYDVTIEGQEVKTIAESTFKRNYKVVNEMENETALTEELPEVEEVVVVEENTLDPEITEPEVISEEVIVEHIDEVKEDNKKEKQVEIVLTEIEEIEIKGAITDLSNVIGSLPITKVTIEKNSRNTKVDLYPSKIQLTLGYENRLMDYIVDGIKEKISEHIEVEYINQQKRSNPAAFKARGVRTINKETQEELTFKTRNDAMIWITKEFEDGKVSIKPTYYKVKKALEAGGGEYLGYNWEECDPSEAVTVQ